MVTGAPMISIFPLISFSFVTSSDNVAFANVLYIPRPPVWIQKL